MDKKEYHRLWRLKNKDKINGYARTYRNKYKEKLRFIWAWRAMKRRCTEENYKQYKDYGGRGVTYCDRWKSFKNFKDDMLDSYRPDLTLDRVDTNGNYCKENCRWVTHKEQNNNKRCNIIIKFQGQKKTLLQWHKDLKMNMDYGTLRQRYYSGMKPKNILKIGLYRPAKL